VRECTQNYGKVKLVLQRNRFFLESAHPEVLRTLLKARAASRARSCADWNPRSMLTWRSAPFLRMM
jgi:DNA excision repair protein ERCC-3